VIEKDIVILGGGPGGYVAALHAAHLGARVALIEKDKLGGTCLNCGCIPTKALAKSVEVFQEASKAEEFGIETGGVRANFQKIMERKDRLITGLVGGVEQLLKMSGVTIFRGSGRIVSPRLVKVNDDEITAGKIIIATGSMPALLPVPGGDLPGVYNTDGILELKELPKRLVIIGGGYVGAEFACIFSGLGTKVTVVEMLPMCLATSDDEICKFFSRSVRRLRIDVKTGTAVKSIVKGGDRLKVVCGAPAGEQTIEGEAVLLAAGRVPYAGGLNLSELGIEMDRRAIKVNDYLETSVPGIYAIGDVTGKVMLAHVASYQGEIAVENALGRSARAADYGAVPSCIFTRPEMASVGMTEKDAKERGIDCKISKFPFSACSRAATVNETMGLVKIISGTGDGRVLGMHIIGPNASELIAQGTLAVRMGLTAEQIAHTIHAHPTLSEAIHEAAMGCDGFPIHFQKL